MRFLALLIAVMLTTAGVARQEAPPAGSPPPGFSSSGFFPSNKGSVPQTTRRPPQAKTEQEYNDYNVAYALNGGPAVEQAVDAFAVKYPQSELRSYLYAKAMREYQNENNPGKMLAMGEKVLALDPDNSIALVLTATALADSLSDADQDRAAKIAEIKKNCKRALETLDSSFVAPAGASEEQIAAYKNTLQAMARSALGMMELKTGDDAAAESDLSLAADLNKTQPDPHVWYYLALAQDHLASAATAATAANDKQRQKKKYAEALISVNLALQYCASNPDLQKLAQSERDRLQQQLAESGHAAQSRPQTNSSTPAPPQ